MFSISVILNEKKYRDTLEIIVQIFESTRIVQKMQSWKPDTIQKAFKWADIMSDMEARPSDERRFIVSSYFAEKFDQFDISNEVQGLLFVPAMKPVHLTFWIVLTSPFLGCNSIANTIITEVVKQTFSRLGVNETQNIISILMRYLIARNRFDDLHSNLKIPSDDHAFKIHDCSMAFQFIFAYASSKARILIPEEPQDFILQIKNLILCDAMTLKAVSLALVLPSSYISYRYFQSNIGKANNSGIATIKISLDEILEVSNDVLLWNIIIDGLAVNVTRFFELDDNFTICKQLCSKNSTFFSQFAISIKDLIYPQWILFHNNSKRPSRQDIQIKDAMAMLQQVNTDLPAWEKNADISFLIRALESI